MVSESYAYRNGSDPEFWDNADVIKCSECERYYNYKFYQSFTCAHCENEGK